jgi:predicted nucleotidyltransferase
MQKGSDILVTAGIIAEYNPFHSGHMYHIEATRAAGATHIVAVMSGDFVQRGEAAVVSKWARAEMALRCGADLVIQLPLPWSAASAQQFALGAVQALDALGCVDMLSFGSESGDLCALQAAAQAADDPDIAQRTRELMSDGRSYACAREHAVRLENPVAADALGRPNDTLAVEYMRALKEICSGIVPFAVTRTGAAHDSSEPEGETASASHIRSLLLSGRTEDALRYMPPDAAAVLCREIDAGYAPCSLSLAESAVLAHLRRMSAEDFARLPDISEGLENRLYACARDCTSIEDIYSSVKSKRYTHARIRRLVLAAFLGLEKSHSYGGIPYLRVLGMNSRGREILSAAKPLAKLPLITRAKSVFSLDKHACSVFNLECRASDLFALMSPRKKTCGSEQTTGILTL